MPSSFPPGLVLIVTGTTLRAEQMDRPLAYYLQSQVEEHSAGDAQRHALVICDARYLSDSQLQELPAISVGGPGVNQLAQDWLEKLPALLAVEDKFFIQLDPDATPMRASIWGMNNPLTKVAVVNFVEKYLPTFLQSVWEVEP